FDPLEGGRGHDLAALLPRRLGCSDPVVDVLAALQLQKEPEGVRKTAGFCPQKRAGSGMGTAFRISRRAQISAPTWQLFPGEFPADFSVMALLKAKPGRPVFLLSLYDRHGVQQLGIELGRSPRFLYRDQSGRPAPDDYPVFRGANLTDGRWHRLALSVKKKQATLFVDCKKEATVALPRGNSPMLDVKGITVFGARILDEGVFEVERPPTPSPSCCCGSEPLLTPPPVPLPPSPLQGDIQQLLISSSPQAAQDYCPDCGRAPQKPQAQEVQQRPPRPEVRRGRQSGVCVCVCVLSIYLLKVQRRFCGRETICMQIRRPRKF
uniref:Thrombospondin-like N-terminal domain-containing protein n=1 Tax=Pseudonaja textilis TaxID=8673 RepID=A0A670ZSP5_PSETE